MRQLFLIARSGLAACLLGLTLLSASSIPAARSDQTDTRLPSLFDRLKSTKSLQESHWLEMRIWHIWQEHPSETITRLMDEGEKALAQADLTAAMERYTEVTLKDPNYAEGWNKRALVHYLMKQYQASLSDIRKTLILEPRHFGALSGRGLIYAAQKRWKLAEKAFKEALEIHPNMRGPRTNLHIIEQLRPEEEI